MDRPEARLLNKNAADKRRLAKVWDLPDGRPDSFTAKVWLRKGAVPFVSWANGISSKGNIRRVAEKHHPEVIRATTTQLDAAKLGDPEAQALVEKLARNENNPLLSELYRDRVFESGTWMSPDRYMRTGHLSATSFCSANKWTPQKSTLMNLCSVSQPAAFRQPVKPEEVKHYAQFVRDRIAAGNSHRRAIKLGLTIILTSPRFLYLDEGNADSGTSSVPMNWQPGCRISSGAQCQTKNCFKKPARRNFRKMDYATRHCVCSLIPKRSRSWNTPRITG